MFESRRPRQKHQGITGDNVIPFFIACFEEAAAWLLTCPFLDCSRLFIPF